MTEESSSFKNIPSAGPSCYQHSLSVFYMAVTSDNAQFIRHLVLSGQVDVDAQFFPGDVPAVSVAIQGSRWDAFDTLLSLGCSVSVTDNRGRTPLLLACELEGRIEYVKRLLKERASVNAQDKVVGWSALHWATSRLDGDLVSLLLSSGAHINKPNFNYCIPLDFAVRSGWLAGVYLLLHAGSDSNYRDKEGFSPFYYAARCINDINNRHQVLLMMLACGADINMEYWATDDAPDLITGIDPRTLAWFGALRRSLPLSLKWSCRSAIRRHLGTSADSQIPKLTNILPSILQSFMLLEQ